MSELEREQPWRSTPLHGEFSIKKVYIKDTSFETPNSPQIFQANWEPEMDVHLHSHSSDLDAGEFEVVLMVTVTVTVGGKTAFLAEAAVAGIFGITGLTSDEMGPTLGSYCPGMYQQHISSQFSEQQAQIEE
jgi:preprotein translocase subunit SecB